jgi:hypothetical protein
MNEKQTKQKSEKQTKEAETSKVKGEKQTGSMNAWTLLREFFRAFPRGSLRESEG